MRRFFHFLSIIAALIIASLACNVPQLSAPPPTATATATSTTTPTSPPLPTHTPAEPMATLVPPTATAEAAVSPYQPAGYYVVPPPGGTILVYDLGNQVIAQLGAPGLYGDNPSYAHLAGHLSNGAAELSVAFFSWEAKALLQTDQGGVSTLREVQEFYMLAGIPSTPFIAFTELEYADAGLRSMLSVGELGNIATAPAIATVVDSGSYAMRPLAIAHDQGQARGVYFTMIPYGIGGDIVFEPRQNLKYLDLTSYLSSELLDISTSPSGFSPDMTWLAFTPLHSGSMRLAPLANLASAITLPLLPDSDRGAGEAVFSPDNQYIAWKEGSGWMMSETPNFHATIRIATTSGGITAQIPDSAIAALIGNPSVVWVQPVGWLDNTTLLLEARGDEWNQASLLRVNPDGSGLAYLVPGGFMGFVYP